MKATPERFRDCLILSGPTGSGKSALALDLADKLNAEIVSMDSMSLYRGMDIGTAKPTADDRARVLHHLVDVLDPWESGNIAWWLERAAECVDAIHARGKQALFVGGTPFYLKALLYGLFDGPPVDETLRIDLEQRADALGNAAMHARLAEIDPVTAARLHVNDRKRVLRAIEVYELSGRPIGAWQEQNWFDPSARPAADDPSFSRCLAIEPPREELYRRIDRRVLAMLESGWVEEVERLRELAKPLSREAQVAIGYRELGDYLDGKIGYPEVVPLIQMRSRQYAKRQLTWFRGLKACELVRPELTFERWRSKMNVGLFAKESL